MIRVTWFTHDMIFVKYTNPDKYVLGMFDQALNKKKELLLVGVANYLYPLG